LYLVGYKRYIGILLGAHPVLHVSRIRVKHYMKWGIQGADILTSVICGCAWTASRCGYFILKECPLDTAMV
jgi:hypothetical protein